MNFLDIVIGLLLIWGFYKGIKNGLFVEIASLVAIVAAIYGAIHFSYIAGDYLSKNLEWTDRYINLTAFIITFIVIIVVVSLAGKLLTKMANFAMLGMLNKIAGGIFGALKIAIILGALLVFFHKANSSFHFFTEENLNETILYQPVKEIGDFVFSKVLKE